LVDTFILARTRDIPRLTLSASRKLNGTSDMVRYHIMRNRGYMARYFALYGDFHPVWFGLGTALTLAKELIRLIAVDHSFRKGVPALLRGIRDARVLRQDQTWEPMPALV
jgi:hypothetical protein